MIRGTTPTITMTLPEEIPVDEVTAAVFSIAQAGQEIISKKLSELTADATSNTLAVTLLQEDTLALDKDVVAEIQIKVKTNAERVLASDIIRTSVDRIINGEVI